MFTAAASLQTLTESLLLVVTTTASPCWLSLKRQNREEREEVADSPATAGESGRSSHRVAIESENSLKKVVYPRLHFSLLHLLRLRDSLRAPPQRGASSQCTTNMGILLGPVRVCCWFNQRLTDLYGVRGAGGIVGFRFQQAAGQWCCVLAFVSG